MAQNHQHPHHSSSNSSQDPRIASQRLLAAYPISSAIPTTHVTRHLDFPTAVQTPSYVQHNEYAYIGHTNDHYWRNQAVRYVQEQAGPSYPYPPAPPPWNTAHSSAFAQSVITQAAAASAYPTPPPPSSSSSLAGALGNVNSTSSSLAGALGNSSMRSSSLTGAPRGSSSLAGALGRPASSSSLAGALGNSSSLAGALGPPLVPSYKPEDSSKFFDDLLNQKTRDMSVSNPHATPSRRAAQETESPDPLALHSRSMTTPRKRKPVVEIPVGSPSLKMQKRIHSTEGVGSASKTQKPHVASIFPAGPPPPITPSKSTIPITPSSTQTNSTTKSVRKAFTLSHISVPYKPWLTTPTSQRKKSTSTPLLTDRVRIKDGEDDDEESGDELELAEYESPTKISALRAGEREGPLEKLISLIEDIFSAEDSSDSASDFLVDPNTLRKLTKSITAVTRSRAGALNPSPRKHSLGVGRSGAGRIVKSGGKLGEIDSAILSRLLRILARSVRAGEDVEPFINKQKAAAKKESKSPKKKLASKKGKEKAEGERSSKTPVDGEENVEEPQNTPAATSFSAEEIEEKLTRSRDSILAAESVVVLLGSERLAKQLYSEELLSSCLGTVKNGLEKVIYPFIESQGNSASNPSSHSLLSEIFSLLSSSLPRLTSLLSVGMSESIVIQAVYVGVGPFFVSEATDHADSKSSKKGKEKESVLSKTLGKSAMRALRMEALGLIRSIFATYPTQRAWIVEEILTSLIKLSDEKGQGGGGQFRLRNNQSIRTVSALLIQLIQTSAHDVRIEARRIAKERQNAIALKSQASFTERPEEDEGSWLDEHDKEEIRLYSTALDSATKTAKTIVLFLTQRSGRTKATTKSTPESAYRGILDGLITDLLTVLWWPEWPGAAVLLGVVGRVLLSSFDETNAKNTHVDNNALRAIALDHLGVIAAKIRGSALKFDSGRDEGQGRGLKGLDQIIKTLDTKEFQRLLSAHHDLGAHLVKRGSEDQAYDTAQELTSAALGQELASALQWVSKALSKFVTEDGGDTEDELNLQKRGKINGTSSQADEKGSREERKLLKFGRRLKEALQEVWKEHPNDVFDVGTQDEITRIDRLSEELGSLSTHPSGALGALATRTLPSFQALLKVILHALDASQIFMRTKALKALGLIVGCDNGILGTASVRSAIESHLLDSSPAVRDAAVELIGKYVLETPELEAVDGYYSKIADRIADTSIAVRKRVIKLLKAFYQSASPTSPTSLDGGPPARTQRQVDIAAKLVLRMLDEDDAVKDLAIKTIEELWFPPLTSSTNSAALVNKVAVIMGVSAMFSRSQSSPLEDLLHKIMFGKESGKEKEIEEICGVLIDGLIDASDLPGFTVNNCIRTIHLVASAYPSVITSSTAQTLLPYLKSPTNAEEQSTADYLLKIFRSSIPSMPKTAIKFGQELQLALQPMIIKPSNVGGLAALQESVACICVVVQYLTHDFVRLVSLLKSCNARMQDAIRKPSLNPGETRALATLIFITSLLAEHCNFDKLREENPDLVKDINAVHEGSIIEHVYSSLLELHNKHEDATLRARVLQCLGFLFRAQPTLMTLEWSATIMDAIFMGSDEEAKGRLLKIIQGFLVSEAIKHSAKEKEVSKGVPTSTEVNMEELVGNTDGFADSGVASAVVQRYLTHILEACLSQHVQIQASAIEILTFTVKQGLAHPLQSFPYIIALETSPNSSLSSRASSLHVTLHGKHASLLNTRYIPSARMSFDYQRKVTPSPQGYRMAPMPIAVLQRWYSLVRDKRQPRQDFLKALVKVFQDSPSYESSEDDVEFARYMAENFAAFDYKTQEEVLTVIKSLTSTLSTSGTHILEVLSPSHLLASLRTNAQPQPPPQQDDAAGGSVPMEGVIAPALTLEQLPLLRTSIIMAMVMLLKAHLKTLYSLSEEKCSKFVLGKKSAIGDKPATRRHETPISWDRLPFATKPIVTTEDCEAHKSRFLEIWNEDGVSAEPEDIEMV
ncbi:Sister chromatid cohesion protein 2 [Paramarasmius palmivorus]|uniref:Sister chromatid cohesion protein n=1 Tax=Paramarasmius palmivorus TaxID=297713 RepID=A0AAW0DXT3_9AGAR